MQGSIMPMTAASDNMVINQLPQPTRPPNSYDMIIETSSTTYPQILENSNPSNVPQHKDNNIVGHSQNIHVVTPTTAKEEEGERKFVLVDKLVNRVLDKYEKLPASFKDQINLEEKLAKERNRQVNHKVPVSRGLQQPVEAELSENEKLERFKIRTVVVENVDKDDEKK